MADETRDGWIKCEVEIMVDSGGDYAVDRTDGDVGQVFEDSVGGQCPKRLVKLAVWVQLPTEVVLCGEATLVGNGAELVQG